MEQLESLIKGLGKQSIATVFRTIAEIKDNLQGREDAIKLHERELQKLIQDFRDEEDKIIKQIDEASEKSARMISSEEKQRINALKDRKKALSMDLNIVKQQTEKKISEQRRELDQKRARLADAIEMLKNDYLQFTQIRDELNRQKENIQFEYQGIQARQNTLGQMLDAAKTTKLRAENKLKAAIETEKTNQRNAQKIEKAARQLIEKRQVNRVQAQDIENQKRELNLKRANLAEISQKLEARRGQIEADHASLQEQIKIFKSEAHSKLNKAVLEATEQHKAHFQYELVSLEKTREDLYVRIDKAESEIERVSKLEQALEKKRIKLAQVEEDLMLRQVTLESEYRKLEAESVDIRTRRNQLEQEAAQADARTKGIVAAEINLKRVEKDLIKREKALLNKEQHLNLFESKKMAQWEKREKQLENLDETIKQRENQLAGREAIVTAHEDKVNKFEHHLEDKNRRLKLEIASFNKRQQIQTQKEAKLMQQASQLDQLARELDQEKVSMESWQKELVKREKKLNQDQVYVEDLALELEVEKREILKMKTKLSTQLSSLNHAVAEFQMDDTVANTATVPRRSFRSRPSMDA